MTKAGARVPRQGKRAAAPGEPKATAQGPAESEPQAHAEIGDDRSKAGIETTAATGKALDGDPTTRASERGASRKQAVVIVHGMGEQKPLETLRAFVQAVWGSKPIPTDHATPDDIWLVPDMRAGLKELARITTRENKDGVRTDFYELYWSDLMTGNTLTQLRSWVTGLLWRWPHQVPKETFGIWLVLWALAIFVVGIAVWVGLDDPLGKLRGFVGQLGQSTSFWAAPLSFVLAVCVAVYLSFRLSAAMKDLENSDRVFPGIWAAETPREASASVFRSSAALIVVPAAVGFLAWLFVPWEQLWSRKALFLLIAAVIVYVGQRFVIPVFGDVARYVRTSPDAVAARSEIRERGLKLLRELHGVKSRDDILRADYDPGDTSRYERIVVVGHSLGSIVAYDVLRLLWEELAPSKKSPPGEGALQAMEAMEEYLRGCSPDARAVDATASPSGRQSTEPPGGKVAGPKDRKVFNLTDFRAKQAAVGSELATTPGGWRVTDFVTLGSPLTHAEFLISRDRVAFEERKAERLFPTCPPMLEPGPLPDGYSFLYRPDKESENLKLPHHAALFAATRWTNIYDPSRWLLNGDFIGGACQKNFGPGVLDIPVRIFKGGLFSRLVTHTEYWNDTLTSEAGFGDRDGKLAKELEDAVGGALGIADIEASSKPHIELLRAALALGEKDDQGKV